MTIVLVLVLTLVVAIILLLFEPALRLYLARRAAPAKLRELARISQLVIAEHRTSVLAKELEPVRFNAKANRIFGLTHARFLAAVRLNLRLRLDYELGPQRLDWLYRRCGLPSVDVNPMDAIRLLGFVRDKTVEPIFRQVLEKFPGHALARDLREALDSINQTNR